jgi:hypothetical protein
MPSVQITPHLRKYLELRGVFIDGPLDEQPMPEDTFCPTAADEADYRDWCAEIDARDRDLEDAYRESQYQDYLERQQYEHHHNAWTIRPV